MRERNGHMWQQKVVARPIGETVKSLAIAGFNGIYVDRYGYEDNGQEIETKLAMMTDSIPIVSEDGRLSFFSLLSYQQKLRSQNPGIDWEVQRQEALHFVYIKWVDGFYGQEGTPGDNWRWCRSKGRIQVINTYNEGKYIFVEFGVSSPHESNVFLKGDLLEEVFQVQPNFIKQFSKKLFVPPGNHAIDFFSDARPFQAQGDPRELVFQIYNFQWKHME
jgi:phosphoglycerol transferase